MESGLKNGIRFGAMAFAGVTYVLLRRRVTRYEIVDRSMQPALEPGDYVIVDKRRVRPGRGSAIVYSGPSGIDLVKRVVGLPGEIVEIADGVVLIDDVPLADPWARSQTEPRGKWVLGSDEVFTLGDARVRSSGDSRTTGGVALDRIHGRIIGIYWPLRRVGSTRR